MAPTNQQRTTTDSDTAFKFRIGQAKHQITDDRTLLQAVIDFANCETDLRPVRASWEERLAMRLNLFPPYDQPANAWRRYEREVKKRVSKDEVDKGVGDDQRCVRQVLSEAMDDLTSLKNRLQSFALREKGHLGVVRMPVLIQHDNELRVEWTLRVNDDPFDSTGDNLQKILSYVAALLITDENHVRRDLCRCHLETCGNFFFAKRSKSGRGKPRTRYCCDTHMRTAHEMDNARRQRLSKERKRNAALERKPRRPVK